MESQKTVASTRVSLSKIMEPTDANFMGKVFGGSLLAILDLAAYAAASKFASTVCVTASFDRVDFIEPIEVGELVLCEAFVSFVGRTSVEVTIEVYADNLLSGVRRYTNTARVTMVALKDGKPTQVPRLVCESREEKQRFLEGMIRRELRGIQRKEFTDVSIKLTDVPEDRLQELMSASSILKELGS